MSAPATGLPAGHDGTSTPARPARPVPVEVAFWLTAAQAVVGSLNWMAVGLALRLLDTGIDADLVLFVGLCLVGTLGHLGWMVLGWKVRSGSVAARAVFTNLTVAGLVGSIWLCSIGWWAPLPGIVLLGAILLLLSRPASNAWFRR